MGMSGVDALARLRHVFLNPDDCNRVKNSARSLAVLSSSTIGLRNMRLTRQSKEPRFPYVCFTTDGDVAGFYAISAIRSIARPCGRVASAKCPCKNSRDSIGNAGRGFPLSEAGLGLDVAAGCCEEISCGEPANWFPCACRRSV